MTDENENRQEKEPNTVDGKLFECYKHLCMQFYNSALGLIQKMQ